LELLPHKPGTPPAQIDVERFFLNSSC